MIAVPLAEFVGARLYGTAAPISSVERGSVLQVSLLASYLNADRRRTLAALFDALYAVFGVVIAVVLVATVVIGVKRSNAGAAIAAIG